MGMHTPIPTQMIKTSRKGMEGRDPQVLRQTYVHVLVCGAPPSRRSQRKDRNENTMQENTQLKATWEGRILHESQSQQKTIHHEITQLTSIREHGFYTNPNDVTRPKVMDSLHRP